MLNTQFSYYCFVNKINIDPENKIPDYMFQLQRRYDDMVGYHAAQKECAAWIGITEQSFGQLKKGLRMPDLQTTMKIYRATGDKEIFILSGHEQFMPVAPSPTELTEKLLSLPPDDLAKIVEAFSLAVSSMKETGIEINSPEGVDTLNSALREKGLK